MAVLMGSAKRDAWWLGFHFSFGFPKLVDELDAVFYVFVLHIFHGYLLSQDESIIAYISHLINWYWATSLISSTRPVRGNPVLPVRTTDTTSPAHASFPLPPQSTTPSRGQVVLGV